MEGGGWRGRVWVEEMSKGRAEISDSGRFCFFILILVDGEMLLAVARAGWITCAKLSQTMSCALSLLICLHLKAWSPHISWVVPHVHVSGLVGSWMGSLYFCFWQILKFNFLTRM